ncbi:hypothetical protein ABZP36_010500 [Zizania latifolia]
MAMPWELAEYFMAVTWVSLARWVTACVSIADRIACWLQRRRRSPASSSSSVVTHGGRRVELVSRGQIVLLRSHLTICCFLLVFLDGQLVQISEHGRWLEWKAAYMTLAFLQGCRLVERKHTRYGAMAMPWDVVALVVGNVWALLDGWISVCFLAADEFARLLRSVSG